MCLTKKHALMPAASSLLLVVAVCVCVYNVCASLSSHTGSDPESATDAATLQETGERDKERPEGADTSAPHVMGAYSWEVGVELEGGAQLARDVDAIMLEGGDGERDEERGETLGERQQLQQHQQQLKGSVCNQQQQAQVARDGDHDVDAIMLEFETVGSEKAMGDEDSGEAGEEKERDKEGSLGAGQQQPPTNTAHQSSNPAQPHSSPSHSTPLSTTQQPMHNNNTALTPSPCWHSWWPHRTHPRPFWRYTRQHKLQRWFGLDHFCALLPHSFSRRLMVGVL